MIDEIERAQFEEIYRLVEIIERFRNEGRSGLPIRLVFLLCLSESDLEKYLDTFSTSDTKAYSLRTFFYQDPKSIAYKVFLPPVDPVKKINFVIDLIKKIITNQELNVAHKDLDPNTISSPEDKFLDYKKALEYTIALLSENTPREIKRTINSLDFFYGSYKNTKGILSKNAIRFSDIVLLEYIKIKYPYLIDFFRNTIHILINESEGGVSRGQVNTYFLRRNFEERNFSLIDWVEEFKKSKMSEVEKQDILKLIGLVAHSYVDFFKKNLNTKATRLNYI